MTDIHYKMSGLVFAQEMFKYFVKLTELLVSKGKNINDLGS